MLSLRHFRLARWCSLSLREWCAEGSARRISTCRLHPHPLALMMQRLLTADGADGDVARLGRISIFAGYSGFEPTRILGRSERSTMRPPRSYRVMAPTVRHRKLSVDRALHRALSPTFPAGAMVFFIPSRGGAEGSGAAHLDLQTDPHPPP